VALLRTIRIEYISLFRLEEKTRCDRQTQIERLAQRMRNLRLSAILGCVRGQHASELSD
jgi:hypothetical protein